MGLLDEIDKLELSDEQKEKLRSEFDGEVDSKDTELATLRRRNKKKDVDAEVSALDGLGFSESPGLLKFVRRVFMSDDEQPGIVLFSDADLELSGDEAVGARSREEMSTAAVLREFIKLMPRNADGKLNLSDQAFADDNHDGPPNEEQETDTEKAEKRGRVERVLGRPVERKRSRYQGTVS